jgi:formylmethanofuran dehydrogenase subunit E
MKPFEELLASSVEAHGHLCPGQVVGVRMAILGCRLIRLDEPTRRDQIKKLIVYVEMDRCTADAVAHVTGVKLGRRSLKFMDYGRDLATIYAPEVEGRREMQTEAYRRMPDSVLFRVQEVKVVLSEFDLPGPTRRKASCSRCGQVVRDNREVIENGSVLCRPCAHGSYFSSARDITWSDINWAPDKSQANKRMKNPVTDAGGHFASHDV